MNYLKMNEHEQKVLHEIQERTITDYETLGDFLPIDSIFCIFEDLLAEIYRLEEEKEDLEKDIQDNYKRVTTEEQLDYSERW